MPFTHIKTIELKEFSYHEVSQEWVMLCEKARESAFRAYAVYSHFRVGAAVLLDDHTIICGNNQENSAYPSGLCAERTALFYAHAQYPNQKIKAIAIYSPDAQSSILTPCGACRQVMVEYEHLQQESIHTLIVTDEKIYVMYSAKDWLPFEFSEKSLK